MKTQVDPLEVLARKVEELGSAAAIARALGVSPSYISYIQSRKRPPSPELCKLLGIRKEVHTLYFRIDEKEAEQPKTPRRRSTDRPAA